MSIRQFINNKKAAFQAQRMARVQNDVAAREANLAKMQEERRLYEQQKALKEAEAQEKAKLRDLRTPEFLKNYGKQVGEQAVQKNTKQPSLFAQNNLGGEYKGIFGNSGVSEYKGPMNEEKKAKRKKGGSMFSDGISEYRGPFN